MASPTVFHTDYQETLVLPDGEKIRLRLIQARDKQKLAEGFERLSAESRYRRCFSLKKALTLEELRFFTELDGHQHLAIGAVQLNADGSEGEGIGGARFIRLAAESDVAEFALAVVDEWQGQGLGRILLERLVQAAAERGINSFRCYLMTENVQLRGLLDRVAWNVQFHSDGMVLAAEFPLPSGQDTPAEDSVLTQENLYRLLGMASEGSLAAPLALAAISSSMWWQQIEKNLYWWRSTERSKRCSQEQVSSGALPESV
ncbi:MAG: GNAT family N-acetyltransferase [Gammaproteobacteria bacterium]